MHLICFTAISFPGFTISKKWTRICLKPSSQIKLASLYPHWLFPGRKISYSTFVSSMWKKEIPGAALPTTPSKPAWDSQKAYVGQRYCKSLLVFPWWGELQLYYSNTLAVFLLCYTANSYLIGSCWSYSHLVFSRDLLVTVYCGLDNTCIFADMPFYFQLLYPSHLSIFHSLLQNFLIFRQKVSWQEVLNRTELTADLWDRDLSL